MLWVLVLTAHMVSVLLLQASEAAAESPHADVEPLLHVWRELWRERARLGIR